MSSRRKQTKKVFEQWQTNGNSNFMQIFHDFFDSKAWQDLTAHERDLYLFMLRKHQRSRSFGSVENSNFNNISMPKSEYEKIMSNRTFYKAIDNLIEHGFVKVVRSGYAEKICNIYSFSDEWKQYGNKNFEIKNEWRRVKKH